MTMMTPTTGNDIYNDICGAGLVCFRPRCFRWTGLGEQSSTNDLTMPDVHVCRPPPVSSSASTSPAPLVPVARVRFLPIYPSAGVSCCTGTADPKAAAIRSKTLNGALTEMSDVSKFCRWNARADASSPKVIHAVPR